MNRLDLNDGYDESLVSLTSRIASVDVDCRTMIQSFELSNGLLQFMSILWKETHSTLENVIAWLEGASRENNRGQGLMRCPSYTSRQL
jgi:hypothetical protein